MYKHLDEGTIQAFIDGELSDERLEAVAVHFAECERCSTALARAESELSAVENVFSSVENISPCPSQRIWARVANEIEIYETEKRRQPEKTSFWQTWLRVFSPAHLTFAGSLVAVVFGSLIGLTLLREAEEVQTVAVNSPAQQAETKLENKEVAPTFAPSEIASGNQVASENKAETVLPVNKINVVANGKSSARRIVSERRDENVSNRRVDKTLTTSKREVLRRDAVKVAPTTAETIEPREKVYLQTLDALQASVRNDQTLTRNSNVRFAVEKNVASMDSTIKNLRRAVRRNPKDEKARQMLYDSYQNKIEFLSELADQSQVMASLR